LREQERLLLERLAVIQALVEQGMVQAVEEEWQQQPQVRPKRVLVAQEHLGL
jgi:hypothetical protein